MTRKVDLNVICYVENGKMNMCQVFFCLFSLFFPFFLHITSKMYFTNFLTRSIFIYPIFLENISSNIYNPNTLKIFVFDFPEFFFYEFLIYMKNHKVIISLSTLYIKAYIMYYADIHENDVIDLNFIYILCIMLESM